jgi:hypothetical protein
MLRSGWDTSSILGKITYFSVIFVWKLLKKFWLHFTDLQAQSLANCIYTQTLEWLFSESQTLTQLLTTIMAKDMNSGKIVLRVSLNIVGRRLIIKVFRSVRIPSYKVDVSIAGLSQKVQPTLNFLQGGSLDRLSKITGTMRSHFGGTWKSSLNHWKRLRHKFRARLIF